MSLKSSVSPFFSKIIFLPFRTQRHRTNPNLVSIMLVLIPQDSGARFLQVCVNKLALYSYFISF